MENYRKIIAVNLKQLRTERKLSLDNVAKLTGVSKSMISQIEKGEVNPTVSIMWKLANGFKVSFTRFMHELESDVEVVKKSDDMCLLEDEGRVKCYPLFSFDTDRRFETFYVEIDEGGVVNADGHNSGAQEFITMFDGYLIISFSGKNYRVGPGESIRFRADGKHSYMAETECKFSQVIYYPEK